MTAWVAAVTARSRESKQDVCSDERCNDPDLAVGTGLFVAGRCRAGWCRNLCLKQRRQRHCRLPVAYPVGTDPAFFGRRSGRRGVGQCADRIHVQLFRHGLHHVSGFHQWPGFSWCCADHLCLWQHRFAGCRTRAGVAAVLGRLVQEQEYELRRVPGTGRGTGTGTGGAIPGDGIFQ